MKTRKHALGALIVICLCINNSLLIGINTPKASVKLKYVFTSEIDSTNKDILKLYEDGTYEYLFFQMVKNKPKVKREKGTYSFNGKRLVLNIDSKTPAKEHPFHFTFIENRGLTKSQLLNFSKKQDDILYVATVQLSSYKNR